MQTAFVFRVLAAVMISLLLARTLFAQDSPEPSAPDVLPLFAVEITTGANWEPDKPPKDQQFFREHSSNLKQLRDSGSLVMGARYSDKGLIILAAPDEASARAMMDQDPSMQAEVFKYQVHPFNVFYGGAVNTRTRRPQP